MNSISPYKPLKFLLNELDESSALTILDLGIGQGNYWNNEMFKTLILDKKIIVTGMDIVSELNAVDLIKTGKIAFIQGNVTSDLAALENKSFDIVIAMDLLEHMPKSDGYKLLYEMERIARKASMIMTPNGFVWQPPNSENPYNHHLSGWTPGELRKFGWKRILGVVGFKALFKEFAEVRFGSKIKLLRIISLSSSIIIYRLPSMAFSFVAIKKFPKF